MAAYVEMDQVTKTYQMGEVTIKAADGASEKSYRRCISKDPASYGPCDGGQQ